MRILIGVDGSSSSDAVIEEAARRPWPPGSELCLVTLVDPFFFPKAPQLMEEAKKNALESVKGQAKLLTDAGWAVQFDVILDNPRHGLPRAAGAWKADLILLGSHGRSAVQRLLVGSTARTVLRHAPCSVEIVRRQSKEETASGGGMNIVIPTDGSEFANAALRSVAERPWPGGSVFKVVGCPEYPVLVGEYPYYPPQELAELLKNSQEHACETAIEGERLLMRVGLKACHELTPASEAPASAILTVAEQDDADLIVLGSHGRRGLDRLILGSVSETVALHAHCSVEVVRGVYPLN